MSHYFTNDDLVKSEVRKIKYTYKSTSFTFFSNNGVFSKVKIDYGSRVLVESFLQNNNVSKKVLDVGCGYGFIGIVISKITDSLVSMIDINKRAVHLTNRNIVENKVNANAFVSDVYSEVNEKYDVIITNPPIRAGKNVVLDILENARNYLNKEGELWFVIRKNQGAKSIKSILDSVYNIEIIEKSKGFYVFRAIFR